jgi:hypothetical protein
MVEKIPTTACRALRGPSSNLGAPTRKTTFLSVVEHVDAVAPRSLLAQHTIRLGVGLVLQPVGYLLGPCSS